MYIIFSYMLALTKTIINMSNFRRAIVRRAIQNIINLKFTVKWNQIQSYFQIGRQNLEYGEDVNPS